MNKNILVTLFSLTFVLWAILAFKKNKQPILGHFTIGVLQTASFPALDEARDGFISQVKKEFGDKVDVIVQNAEGSLTQAQTIAASFKSNKKISGFYAIATPAVEALNKEITDRPIVFAAVTDPGSLHLREFNSNITGATDMANIQKQIQILHHLLPNLKKVSLLYNPAEPNSVTLVKRMKEELAKQNIDFEEDGVNSQSDVAAAALHATRNAQAILIPTDNTISASFPIVKQIADKLHVPVVVTWTGEKNEPLMQFGVNYMQSGKQAAQQMKEILLNKKSPIQIPVANPDENVILSSVELKKFNIKLSKQLEIQAFEGI